MVTALNEVDLYNQLQTAKYELIDCKAISDRNQKLGIDFSKIETRDIIQLFINLEQMQGAGIPLLDALSDIRDTVDNSTLKDMLSDIARSVSDGSSLSEAMSKYPKYFPGLHISLIKAGEETGDFPAVYRQLIRYLKWTDDMQRKIKKATQYPIIILIAVMVVMGVMMGYVVPQVVGFIENMDQELPFYTAALIATSEFFQNYWTYLIIVPSILVVASLFLKRISREFCYNLDLMILNLPLFGTLIRKISISRYCQTFGALFGSGVDVIRALESSRETITNLAMIEAMETVEEYVQAGSSLSDAFKISGEFPNMVVRMLKIGEESGNLTQVLDQVSEFYTQDVDDSVQSMIGMIEPALTAILGGLIMWIAISVFGPIYSSFETLDF